MLLTAELLAV